MKSCVIKQPYVFEFTYETTHYKDETPDSLLDKFILRSQSYGMITKLEMDIYVVEQMQDTPESIWYQKSDPEAYRLFTNQHKTIPIDDVPLDDYDVVITADGFLSEHIIKNHPDVLFAYFSTEHHLEAYQNAIKQGYPLNHYDLFLDHALSSTYDFNQLPANINFPFMVDKDVMRRVIDINHKTNSIFLDSHIVRTVGFSANTNVWEDNRASIENQLSLYKEQIKNMTGMEIYHSPTYNYQHPFMYVAQQKYLKPREYLNLLGKTRFFPLCRGNLAIGQVLPEAASLQNIIISDDLRYAPLLVHPQCFLNNISLSYEAKQSFSYLSHIQKEAMNIINRIKKDEALQKEILEYQDNQLEQNFSMKQIEILKKALQKKRAS